MDNTELEALVKKDKQLSNIFLGVFPSDKLPERVEKKPCALIINVDPSDKPGQHWVSAYFPVSVDTVDYFDSYGLKPFVTSIQEFLRRNSRKQNFNEQRLQSSDSTVCGLYCLYFLCFRSRNVPMYKIVNTFNAKNFQSNDSKVCKFLRTVFDHVHKVCCKIDKNVQSCTCFRKLKL